MKNDSSWFANFIAKGGLVLVLILAVSMAALFSNGNTNNNNSQKSLTTGTSWGTNNSVENVPSGSQTELLSNQQNIATNTVSSANDYQAQLDAKDAEIAKLQAQISQYAQNQTNYSAAIQIEKCKVKADAIATYNAQQELNVGIQNADARGDYQTASMYMTESPKQVASYATDYQMTYTNCINAL